MSFTRRMIAAGLPAAGVTVFAALALSGAPATAAPADTAGLRPVVLATPCVGGYRGDCPQGYGATTPAGTLPTTLPTTQPTLAGTAGGTPTTTHTTHTRGHGGYGGVSPATTPPTTPTTTPTTTPVTTPATTTPTGNANTVPPGDVSPSSATPTPNTTTPGGGVSAGSALPVTGAPMGAVASLGGLMIAAGAASVWYTRRRRNA